MQKLQSVCFIALSRISFCLDINGLQSGHKELVNKSFNRKTRVAVFQRDGFVSVLVAGTWIQCLASPIQMSEAEDFSCLRKSLVYQLKALQGRMGFAKWDIDLFIWFSALFFLSTGDYYLHISFYSFASKCENGFYDKLMMGIKGSYWMSSNTVYLYNQKKICFSS